MGEQYGRASLQTFISELKKHTDNVCLCANTTALKLCVCVLEVKFTISLIDILSCIITLLKTAQRA